MMILTPARALPGLLLATGLALMTAVPTGEARAQAAADPFQSAAPPAATAAPARVRLADERRYSQDERIRLQQAMSQLGFYSGKADGRFNSAVRKSIKAYQQALGVAKPDGVLTEMQGAQLLDYASVASQPGAAQRYETALVQLKLLPAPAGSLTAVTTRSAISAYQASISAPQTGFLTASQTDQLVEAGAIAALPGDNSCGFARNGRCDDPVAGTGQCAPLTDAIDCRTMPNGGVASRLAALSGGFANVRPGAASQRQGAAVDGKQANVERAWFEKSGRFAVVERDQLTTEGTWPDATASSLLDRIPYFATRRFDRVDGGSLSFNQYVSRYVIGRVQDGSVQRVCGVFVLFDRATRYHGYSCTQPGGAMSETDLRELMQGLTETAAG